MANLDYGYIAELVKQAQTGDSNAFAELYAATYQNQYRFAYSYLKDTYLAQDALQETYILALNNINKVRDPSLIIAWLNQINFRVCYRMQSKNARYVNTEDGMPDGKEIAGDIGNPEKEIVRIDTQQYIIRQVMNLPFTESQVILLRYYRNMKIDEIASLLEISRSTVKWHISSGIKRLKEMLTL